MKSIIKYTLFVWPLLFMMSFQKKSEDTSKVYLMALKEHVSRTEKNIGSLAERNEFAAKTIFVINDGGIELPEKLGSHKLQEMGDSAFSLLKDSVGLHVIKLNPIGVFQGSILVVLSDYVITKRNGEATLSYAGGVEYTFNYNSQSRHYVIVREKSISF
jgi:hypothetical protein